MSTSRRRGVLALVGAVVLAAGLSSCASAPTSTLARPADPVVLTGASVPSLASAPANRLVAFRAGANGGWTQIPVQVDERLTTTVAAIYGWPAGTKAWLYPTSLDVPVNVYADPGTFVGADPDPSLDGDDEIAFMARDAGLQATDVTTAPAGTVGKGVEVAVKDPLDPAGAGFVYLFAGNGTLDPGAGAHYVSYDFKLNSGAYKTTYNTLWGPNTEDSTVRGSTYTTHFASRWLEDSLTLTQGDRPAQDLVDRFMYDISGSNCARTEDTFDAEEGAFVVNKVGPVRALRSYVGANSGPNTQNTHVFYDQAVYVHTDLRVHDIPNIQWQMDLQRPAATGMVYRRPEVPAGITVGAGERFEVPTPASWWTLQGTQGGVAVSVGTTTNMNPPPTIYARYDESARPPDRCTGDSELYGDAGVVAFPLPCTDPGGGYNPATPCTNRFAADIRWVATSNTATPADLQRTAEQGKAPLTFTTRALT
jgi:hypothetical protein